MLCLRRCTTLQIQKLFRKQLKTYYFPRAFADILKCMPGQLSKAGNLNLQITITIIITSSESPAGDQSRRLAGM
jgi:hypothetical protein